jgi:Metallo-beta-lactamase superfamily
MSSVRVRMYRQGLGDCFLLTFPGRERESHVLIDFGVLLGTPGAKQTMQKTARQIVEATGGRLDVLVATHEHWDHVSGFMQAEEVLGRDKLAVGEVWLAWTEKPGDPLAMEMDKRRARALKRIVTATRKLAGATDFGAQRTAERLNGMLEFWGGLSAAERRTTRSALEWVRKRTEPDPPEYLEPGMDPFLVPGTEEIRVYVLGPPRNPKRLKKSDPSKKTSEVYELAGEADVDFGSFAALDSMADGSAPGGQPFEEWFRIDDSEAKGRQFFHEHYGFENDDWRRIEHDWLGITGRLALQLDSDTNNTSLVLAFELGKPGLGRVLLFPGDAQVGNWLSWHEMPAWKVNENGRIRTVTATDLLSRTVLYKVGHHGSHNATLREQGLEIMRSDELAVMLPVHRVMAKQMDWDMPFAPLLARLQELSKGRILDLEKGLATERPPALSERDWTRFLEQQTKITKDWIDLFVEM